MDDSTSSDDREVRAARNQSMFRQINERLTQDDVMADMSGGHVIACECADVACVQTIDISVTQYDDVRTDPRRFAVLPGHVYPDVEIILAEYQTYFVVEKLGRAAEVAEALEPRENA